MNMSDVLNYAGVEITGINSLSFKSGDGWVGVSKDGSVSEIGNQSDDSARFFILPYDCLRGVHRLLDGTWVDQNGKAVSSARQYISNDEFKIFVGSRTITPSILPPTIEVRGKMETEFYASAESHKFFKHNPVACFVIFGAEKYYRCFELSVQSLVEFGKYDGDIFVLCDNKARVEKAIGNFAGRVTIAEEPVVNLYDRYRLPDLVSASYAPIAYFDSDVIFTQDINPLLMEMRVMGDLVIYEETAAKDDADPSVRPDKWFGAHLLRPLDACVPFHKLNSGFFAINNGRAFSQLFKSVSEFQPLDHPFGDQAIMNCFLHTKMLNFRSLPRNYKMRYSRGLSTLYHGAERCFVHFNSGVGDVSKADLMEEATALLKGSTNLIEVDDEPAVNPV